MALLGNQLVVTYAAGPVVRAQEFRDKSGTPGLESTTGGSSGGGKNGDIDLSNILTLVPAEAVAPFLSFKDTPPPTGVSAGLWIWIVFGLCMIICVALRVATTPAPGVSWLRGMNAPLVLVSAIAFFIWAQATTNDSQMVPIFHGTLAGLVATVYGIVAPRFVPGVPKT